MLSSFMTRQQSHGVGHSWRRDAEPGAVSPRDAGEASLPSRCNPWEVTVHRHTLMKLPASATRRPSPRCPTVRGANGLAGRPRGGDSPRKVRAPQSKVVGNTHPGQPAGKCHREQTAGPLLREGVGKGETVEQETTSDPGDRIGSANPTWSKIRQCTSEGCSPECTGRSLEAVGNGSRRWMVAPRSRPRTEPGLQASPFLPAHASLTTSTAYAVSDFASVMAPSRTICATSGLG
jgi:hypothetical protein